MQQQTQMTKVVSEEEIIDIVSEAWEALFLALKSSPEYQKEFRQAMDRLNALNINVRVRGVAK